MSHIIIEKAREDFDASHKYLSTEQKDAAFDASLKIAVALKRKNKGLGTLEKLDEGSMREKLRAFPAALSEICTKAEDSFMVQAAFDGAYMILDAVKKYKASRTAALVKVKAGNSR